MYYGREIATSYRAVMAASEVCRAVQAELVSEETVAKKDRSPVTVADFASQAIICVHLCTPGYDVQVVAEEDANWLRTDDAADIRAKVLRHVRNVLPRMTEEQVLDAIDQGNAPGGASGQFWTLDPIDGTKGFIRGGQYAIALALIEDGVPLIGALACPSLPVVSRGAQTLGCTLSAERGKGAKITGMDIKDFEPIHVTNATRAADIAMCEPFEKGHTSRDTSQRIAQRLGITREPVRIDSQAKYAVVARGEAGAYLRLPSRADYEEKIWDHAAGALILTEAGGKVTDVEGNPLDFSLGHTLRNNRGIVAAAAGVHDEVLAAVQAEL